MRWQLAEQLKSKKFRTMAVGVLITLAARLGLHLDEITTGFIVSIIVSYIIAQGQTDKGKTAALIASQGTVVAETRRTDAGERTVTKSEVSEETK